MVTGQGSKDLVSRRRRARGDAEEEESVASLGDSQSEASLPSDGEQEEPEAEGVDADLEETAPDHVDESRGAGKAKSTGVTEQSKAQTKGSRNARRQKGRKEESEKSQGQQSSFQRTTDTENMMNGLQISEDMTRGETVDFEELGAEEEAKPAVPDKETPGERQRREQDDPRKKRESDPTFIPNRGNFFMHDARIPEQRGFAPPGRGRGRGRGGIGGPFSPAAQLANADRAADAQWTHDLHDTINEPSSRFLEPRAVPHATVPGVPVAGVPKPTPAAASRQSKFSSSKLLGKVQIRVLLPLKKDAVSFPAVPVKQHTRLPDHRPSLRRDKPVRISLPDRPPRYIFPSQERSFIFIPRALRPNQQGFGRPRGSFGHGPSSRRTSAYGGSVYSPSVSMSRRSSMARDIARDQMFSPAGSTAARSIVQGGRPVVRLPQGMVVPPNAISPAGSVIASSYGPQAYPLPQTPAVEHYREAATMHQPRPQKTISVSGIDSPAALSLHAPQQQNQQPFENQLPQHMSDSSAGSLAPPELNPAYYPYQGQTGTPLSNIPERAIHAQPFQPPSLGYGQPYYGQFTQPGYYYPQMPAYMPQGNFPVPPTQGLIEDPASMAHVQQQQHSQHQHQHQHQQPPQQHQQQPQQAPGPIAHESNGMVFYLDPSDMSQYGQQPSFQGQAPYLQPPSYAVPGMGGMMTPSPDGGYYYPTANQGPTYYPPA